jgi:2-octaprenylphenol hydroxylase
MRQQQDICIIGGGMVGLALAKSISKSDAFTISVIEGSKPQLDWQADDYALRVSAINRNSELLLKSIDVWHHVNANSISPYTDMHVWDAGGSGSISMSCLEVGETELGYIIENRAIQKALYEGCDSDHNINLMSGIKVKEVKGEPGNWEVVLENDKIIQAKLIIGADGANSWLRKALDFELEVKPYNQNAIVGVIETEIDHQQTAWQRFLKTGPLAFLPLKNLYQCSIVWSCETDRANHLINLDNSEFCYELEQAIDHKFGKLKLLSKKVQFPLIERHAKSYYKPGVVLVGDAAHTIHPLAGQGVNLGFKDVGILSQELVKAKKSGRLIEHTSTLQAYEEKRRLDNQMTIYGMKFFKECFSNDYKPLNLVRNLGLSATDSFKPLKKRFIYQAMGI